MQEEYVPPLQGPNGAIGVNFLGRVVTSERIESLRERKGGLLENLKFGGDRKSDQDLESGLVLRARVINLSCRSEHVNGANPKKSTQCLHNTLTHQQSSSNQFCPV
jgi:hypothetical protein